MKCFIKIRVNRCNSWKNKPYKKAKHVAARTWLGIELSKKRLVKTAIKH